jgi:hypothetical protein
MFDGGRATQKQPPRRYRINSAIAGTGRVTVAL